MTNSPIPGDVVALVASMRSVMGYPIIGRGFRGREIKARLGEAADLIEALQRELVEMREELAKAEEDGHDEAYQEGYDEGMSEWKSLKAQLWNAMQKWLQLRHGLENTEEGGNTLSDLLDGLCEVEHENKRLHELLRKAAAAEFQASSARRLALEEAAQIALGVGNFRDYQRHELTADFGQPRFDMMTEIIDALRNAMEHA